jgi:hypothetical protein
LATRLREAGKVVYGLGEQKTPLAFQAACDRFIFFEVLKARPVAEVAAKDPSAAPPDLRSAFERALQAKSRDGGWATLSAVGAYMGQDNPSFDTRLYGSAKLGELVRKQPFLEVRETTDGAGNTNLSVRLREGQPGN